MLQQKQTLFVVLAIGFLLPRSGVFEAHAADSDVAALARQLLDESGVAGGLVVHIGAGDATAWGELTAALGADTRYVVQGLYGNPAALDQARAPIRVAGTYGRVSAGLLAGNRLPYADNLVNLIVVSDAPEFAETELMRVLAPRGVAMVQRVGEWRKIVKPCPDTIDDWSHVLHDATNNAVAQDSQVEVPMHMQWRASPKYTRHHERLASVSVVVSSGGRLFSIVDEAPTASMRFPAQWHVVARDAFSGVDLWDRKIPKWESYLDPFRSGPVALSRTMVATPDRLYVTLGLYMPVAVLDTATGKTITTYPASRGTEEILYAGGTLYLVRRHQAAASASASAAAGVSGRSTKETNTVVNRKGQIVRRDIVAIDTRTGKTLWERRDCQPLATTLAVGGGRVYYAALDGVVCLDAPTGQPVWRTDRQFARQRPGWSAPTLVVHDDVVLCADRQRTTPNRMDELNHKQVAAWLAADGWPGDLVAYSASTGKQLWTCRCAETYHAPVDVFVADGLVWVGQSRSRTGPDFTFGRDLHTGEITRRLDTAKAFDTTMPHHRCHRNRATERFLVLGRTGVEFIDLKAGLPQRNHWVRGTCQFGTLPCNGLLYAPPHSCACYIEGKLTGFIALAPETKVPLVVDTPEQRLTRGLASNDIGSTPPRVPSTSVDDWPTYRHDASRSGATAQSVPTELGQLWRTQLGGRLTAPVIADGHVYVAAVDTHTVSALDAKTGDLVWRFTAGGRIDSPPTISAGRVVFGSADGAVYCLRAIDGKLAWRFQAALAERRVVVDQQVESTWPVPGSTLVQDASVYFVAGRSSYVDDGLWIYRLDLRTGSILATKQVYSRDPATGEQPKETLTFELPGALPDVLSAQGKQIFMRHLAFDRTTLDGQAAQSHLFSPAGFLDDTWWHRTYWIFGQHFYSGYIGWYFAGRETPAGRLLVHDEQHLYGFGYRPDYYRGATERRYHLFALDQHAEPPQPPADYDRANRDYPARGPGKFRIKFNWTSETPLLIRAMALAGEKLVAAGPATVALQDESVYAGKAGGLLCVVNAANGTVLKQYHLDSLPVYDALAVAQNSVYLTTTDGSVQCLVSADRGGVKGLSEVVPLEKRLPPLELAPEPGLVGYWKLDEGEGPGARDSSGRKHTGQVAGRWVKDETGTCLGTDARPDALTIPDNSDLHFGKDSFSVAMWLNLAGHDYRLFGKENFPENWWVINVLGDGRSEMVLGYRSRPGHVVRASSKTPLQNNTWLHLAYVVDREAGTVCCYINGALNSTTEIPPSFTDPLDVIGHPFRVSTSHKPFDGLFDELRIYRRALSSEQLQTVFRLGRLDTTVKEADKR